MSENNRQQVPFEVAVSMLPDGELIHTFMSPAPGVLLGADWERESILKAFEIRVELAGPMAAGMDHKLCFFHEPAHDWVFVETRKETKHDTIQPRSPVAGEQRRHHVGSGR